MGTESTGGFKRIAVSNCVVRASDIPHPKVKEVERIQVITAIALEITDGGIMEDISVNNIVAEHVFAPIFIKLGNRARKHCEEAREPLVGEIRNIIISNLQATGAGPFSSSITGFPGHYVENVTLQNIHVSHVGGGKEEEILRVVPENEKDYPEIKMFDNDWHGPRLPSYGLFVRHVDGLIMNNVSFDLSGKDERIPVYTEDVKSLITDEISEQLLP
jgi:hypothetical protein